MHLMRSQKCADCRPGSFRLQSVTGTARIGAAARQEGLGLAVLAQPQGHPTAGAVGGQATGGLGTRGLGQVKRPCGHRQGPPVHKQPHRSLHLLYRERDETAHRHEGSHWGGMQEGQRHASSTSNGGESRGTASSITPPTGIPGNFLSLSHPRSDRESLWQSLVLCHVEIIG
jgi:hypothetical protein